MSLLLLLSACKKDEEFVTNSKLIIKLEIDSTQVRLGNNGEESTLPFLGDKRGQHPKFNTISANYLELSSNPNTPLGGGVILYNSPETTLGGSKAIDISKAKTIVPGDVFLEIPIKNIPVGDYEWVRLSVCLQNYALRYYYDGIEYNGTMASFIGYKNYISSLLVKYQTLTVNSNQIQGFWAFESILGLQSGLGINLTTVPNVLASTSPNPTGSSVITGKFQKVFTITGKEKNDITVTLSISSNNSFVWKDLNGNGRWDLDQGADESIVDMGLRGLIPIVQ
ncbi:MAG: hypothetical protein FGM14_11880 [Flavobacteriales bacterium]|nr:hypothetical protein [Flavobacteriales bacterium]